MSRSTHFVVPIAIVGLCLVSKLEAQSPAAREKGVAVTAYTNSTGGIGSLALSYNESGSLDLVWRAPGSSAVSLPSPFPVGGDIVEVAPGRFLVSGFEPAGVGTPARGHVLDVVLQASPPTIVVQATLAYGTFDFHDLEYRASDGLLYALDWHSHNLVATPWTGSLPAEGAFIVVASASALPMLRGAVQLRSPSTGSGVVVVNQGFAEGTLPVSATITFTGTGFAITPTFAAPPQPQWSFTSCLPNANGPTVGVQALVGASGTCGIQDVVGTTLASATAGTNGGATLLVPRGTLIPGASYRLVGSTGAASNWQTINSSWGSRTGGNLVLRREIVGGLHVGNAEFDVTMRGFWGASTAPVGPVETYLMIGFNLPGPDNVTLNATSGVATITSAAAVVGPMPMSIGSDGQGAAAVRIPVSSDPGVAGLEVLFQWIAWDGSTWSFSEVHGSQIFTAPAAFAQSMAASSTPSNGGAVGPSSAAQAKARVWLDAANLVHPTPAKLFALRQAITAAQP